MPNITNIPQCGSGLVTASSTTSGIFTWEVFDSGSPVANSTTTNGWNVTGLSSGNCTVSVPSSAAISSLYDVIWNVSGVYNEGLFGVIPGTCPQTFVNKKTIDTMFLYKGVLSMLVPYNSQNVIVDLSNPTAVSFDLGTWETTYIGLICSTPSNVTSSGFYPPDYIISLLGQAPIQVNSGTTAYVPVLPNVPVKGTINLVNISTKPTVTTPVIINLTSYR